MHDCKAPSLREGWGGLPLPKQGGLGWVSSWGGSPLPRERVGRGRLLTLHRNTLSSNELRRKVKFFYLLQLFNDTISIHSEMNA